jgi:hypothetical protein
MLLQLAPALAADWPSTTMLAPPLATTPHREPFLSPWGALTNTTSNAGSVGTVHQNAGSWGNAGYFSNGGGTSGTAGAGSTANAN